ncbi:hypothetical protein Q2T41_11765 [Maribacter confluentis]|uniref:histidine kinase n=1 Tax=Maribacter confluentis TaxID=1656093 RepID=A0ABT8RQX1_9FLAO|nr:ATP-binding protein [Maribacter confluentis]MDO1513334.1 hypothetical protein [Maribacter confluentis]
MKRILLLILLGIWSCSPTVEEGFSNNWQSEVNRLYKASLNKELSLTEQMQQINKAFSLVDIDKAESYSKILYQKNRLHLMSQEIDSLKYYHELLLTHALQQEDFAILGSQYYVMAYYYDQIAHLTDSAFVNYNRSKSYYQKVNDSAWVAKNLLHMGIIQKNKNDFFGSKESLTEAIEYINPTMDSNTLASCYNLLATNHRKLLNYNDAIDYYEKAISVSNVTIDQLIFTNNKAVVYTDADQNEKAVSLLNSLVKDSILAQHKEVYARVLDNLAYAKWRMGSKVNEQHFLEPLRIRSQIKDNRGKMASFTHLGEFYSGIDKNRARALFDSVIQLSKKLKTPRAEKEALANIMDLAPNNLEVRNRYVFLQDSLYEQELKVKTQFAKFKYDDRVTQASNLRLEKENAEQRLRAAQQEKQKIVVLSIGGVILLLALFGIYYYGQRSRKLVQENKTAKLEATYATEAELSKKLHDEFGGKLNHAMLLLQDTDNHNEVMDIVDALYNQSRDISREINDVDTGIHFKEVLFGMMGNYCKNTKLIITGSNEVDWSKISTLSKKTLYKVLQELMINMHKHSKATLVSVSFEKMGKKLQIDYADNGVGAPKEAFHVKNGLWNTEKRIHAIDGTIIFDSEEGRGFEARLVLPN